MKRQVDEYLKINSDYTRANALDFINLIFNDFLELSGDRISGDDKAIIGGIAKLDRIAVTVIAQMRGKTLQENIQYNYSMCHPEGYRKSLRLMKQAEKFKRPIICFIDTVGAFPGEEAEKRGQASAIANNLMDMMYLKVPIISVLIGNGGSGGALALCVANEIVMLENALLSVISPKGCANILWKDSGRDIEAAKLLKMTSYDLKEFKIIDEIIEEYSFEQTTNDLKNYLVKAINKYHSMPQWKLLNLRYKKYRAIGKNYLIREKKI